MTSPRRRKGRSMVIEAKKGATMAVKVTDMLGEEVLVVGEE